MNEELTREVLEALGSCMNACGDDCKARGVCLPGQSYVRRKLATALLEERAKPKGDVWENAPDNAGHAWIAYKEMISERTKSALRMRKEKGMKLGRPAGKSKLDERKVEIEGYQKMELSKAKIAKLLGCSRTTYLAWLEKESKGGK